jgi:hypothetical protein
MEQDIIGEMVLHSHLFEVLAQHCVGCGGGRGDIARHKMQASGKLRPGCGIEVSFVLDVSPHFLAKCVVVPVSAGHPKDGKRVWQ